MELLREEDDMSRAKKVPKIAEVTEAAEVAVTSEVTEKKAPYMSRSTIAEIEAGRAALKKAAASAAAE